MRISDWSSDVCSSDLEEQGREARDRGVGRQPVEEDAWHQELGDAKHRGGDQPDPGRADAVEIPCAGPSNGPGRLPAGGGGRVSTSRAPRASWPTPHTAPTSCVSPSAKRNVLAMGT